MRTDITAKIYGRIVPKSDSSMIEITVSPSLLSVGVFIFFFYLCIFSESFGLLHKSAGDLDFIFSSFFLFGIIIGSILFYRAYNMSKEKILEKFNNVIF